ncbi:MAG: PqqD family protein [Clostridia bacterium]|nr:PqqD family protein [Clostridia bacterium]
MKLKDGVIITKLEGGFVAVDSNACEGRFNGMIKMNSTAAFIAVLLKNGADRETLITKMLEKYDTTEEKAAHSVDEVVNTLRREGLIEDE